MPKENDIKIKAWVELDSNCSWEKELWLGEDLGFEDEDIEEYRQSGDSYILEGEIDTYYRNEVLKAEYTVDWDKNTVEYSLRNGNDNYEITDSEPLDKYNLSEEELDNIRKTDIFPDFDVYLMDMYYDMVRIGYEKVEDTLDKQKNIENDVDM
jgi:hypothetical protein